MELLHLPRASNFGRHQYRHIRIKRNYHEANKMLVFLLSLGSTCGSSTSNPAWGEDGNYRPMNLLPHGPTSPFLASRLTPSLWLSIPWLYNSLFPPVCISSPSGLSFCMFVWVTSVLSASRGDLTRKDAAQALVSLLWRHTHGMWLQLPAARLAWNINETWNRTHEDNR